MKLYKEYNVNNIRGSLYCGDAIDFLANLRPDCADIVLLDPPFNLGKKYGHSNFRDKVPEDHYQRWMLDVLNQAIRVLKPGGALYLYHLPQWAMRFGTRLEQDLHFRHWIAVSMKYGFARGAKLYPAHYALLYFTKGEPAIFQRPKTQIAVCRKCGNSIKDYGGYKKIIETNGLNLSDVWDDLSPVRHRSTKYRPQNELPMELTDRVIHISGKSGALFVDPFAGGGTAVVSAVHEDLTFLANDLIEANCEVIDRRLQSLE